MGCTSAIARTGTSFIKMDTAAPVSSPPLLIILLSSIRRNLLKLLSSEILYLKICESKVELSILIKFNNILFLFFLEMLIRDK